MVSYVQARGLEVASADDIAKRLMQNPAVQAQISAWASLPNPYDSSQLRAAMFERRELRKKVNALVHPLVMRAIKDSRARFIEVPLLFEACIQASFDRIWVVTCGEQEQRRRLQERLHDPALVQAVLKTQLPTGIKCAFADEIIRTNLNEDSVKGDVWQLVDREIAK